MPELPEVESYRKYVTDTSLRQRIDTVHLKTRGMLLDTTDKALKDEIEGNTFTDTFRHGKFLFIKLKTKSSLMLHFGMTGDLEYVDDVNTIPRFSVIRFQFRNKKQLAFTDARRFGKIALVNDVDAFIRKRGYGADALSITREEFLKRFSRKRTPIKVSLMDQKAIAGVGNEYSDEILYRSRIHPASNTAKLPEKQLRDIYKHMIAVLKEAVKRRSAGKKMTGFFFLESRKAGLTCRRCKSMTAWKTIGGRSSYFCPSCQKHYK